MTPTRLEVDPQVWEQTVKMLQQYTAARVEAGCLWYGSRDADRAFATLLGVPKQINRPLNFEIPADALAEINLLVPSDVVVVAQIHSHPGSDSTQSCWDDRMIVSRRAVSIVIPNYGALPCDLALAGVHIHDGRHWVKLDARGAADRVIVNPTGFRGVVDAR